MRKLLTELAAKLWRRGAENKPPVPPPAPAPEDFSPEGKMTLRRARFVSALMKKTHRPMLMHLPGHPDTLLEVGDDDVKIMRKYHKAMRALEPQGPGSAP